MLPSLLKIIRKCSVVAAEANASRGSPRRPRKPSNAIRLFLQMSFHACLHSHHWARNKNNYGWMNVWPCGHLPEANEPMTPLWTAVRLVGNHEKPQKQPLVCNPDLRIAKPLIQKHVYCLHFARPPRCYFSKKIINKSSIMACN